MEVDSGGFSPSFLLTPDHLLSSACCFTSSCGRSWECRQANSPDGWKDSKRTTTRLCQNRRGYEINPTALKLQTTTAASADLVKIWYNIAHGTLLQHRRAVFGGRSLHAPGDGATAAGCLAYQQEAVFRRPRPAAVRQDDGVHFARQRDEREGRCGRDLLFAGGGAGIP